MEPQQALIEQHLRMLIGDLQIQLIFAKVKIGELEQALQQPAQQQPANVNGAFPAEAPPMN